MRFEVAAVLAAASTAIASPISNRLAGIHEIANAVLVPRQTGTTATELESGACKRIIFIYARGSTEPGNLGDSGGPQVCDGLKSRYGAANVACQGVGGPYTASLLDNLSSTGTSTAAINEGLRLFNLANTKCPNSIIVGGGYSQGAAVIHGLAKKLSTTVQNKVAGLITFGDTRNGEDGGKIPPFPAAKVKIYCLADDGVCGPVLDVTAAHSNYAQFFPDAVNFLAGRIGA
ncbi:cutinase-like protein 8 [Elsinoe australis]|uniref:Cutinase n=1 Tax=Elsinoe australis TaxID=40998 RepID=A0A4U7ASF8_9PEZI|nr:cutinase-like protein 8 [Elsinoe australis]